MVADNGLGRNVPLSYIPVIQVEILYVRVGSEVAIKSLFILAATKRPLWDKRDTPDGLKQSRLVLLEVQRQRVDTVAQPGRCRAILEHVAEVGIAPGAQHLDASHAMAGVGMSGDVFGVALAYKTRPAAARVELVA